MAVKKSDWAIREEKNAMLRQVNDIRRRYAEIDDAAWTLTQNPAQFDAALKKYLGVLRRPILRFFAGDTMEQIAVEAHDQFLFSLREYVQMGRVNVSRQISNRLLESLRTQIVGQIDGFMANTEALLKERAQALRVAAAEGSVSAIAAELGLRQLKTESVTARTTGAENLEKAWSELTAKYGGRDTVKYRDGKNYPLNTYLDGKANTTSADIHRTVTQLDAAESGIFTGKISSHGATDSCKPWEGKIVAFSAEGRDMLSKRWPGALNLKTVDEIKADKETHLWKFNCRHIVTPYPVQFMPDAEQLLGAA